MASQNIENVDYLHEARKKNFELSLNAHKIIEEECHRLEPHPNVLLSDRIQLEEFKQDMLLGYERLKNIKDKYRDRPALVAGLGPSLLDIDKEKYVSHIKITCNEFNLIPDFFEELKPDFWVAANSFESLKLPFSTCLKKNIKTFISVPIKKEFYDLLAIAKKQNKIDFVYPWLWAPAFFQSMLAIKYGLNTGYSHCNTATNHMIGFALWLGCTQIDIAGFDLSYKNAINRTGYTHAGTNNPVAGKSHFDQLYFRRWVIKDLKYLCALANANSIKINNLSYKINGLPKILS